MGNLISGDNYNYYNNEKPFEKPKILTEHEIALQDDVNAKISVAKKWAFSKTGQPKKLEKIESSLRLLKNVEYLLSIDDEISNLVKNELLNTISTEQQDIARAYASIVLQKNIRGKQAQDLAIMPHELRFSWAVFPPLAKMKEEEQKDLSQIIAHELQNVLANPSLHNKDQYFKKNTAYKLNPHSISDLHNVRPFYIRIDTEKKIAIISINEPKSQETFLGDGSFKTVHSGYEVKVPLKFGKHGRLIAETKNAVARPKMPETFLETVLEPNRVHTEIYNQMKSKNIPGRLTHPPKLLEHLKNGEKKQKLVQTLYPSNLEKLGATGTYQADKATPPKFVTYETKLLLVEELFETVDSLGNMGIVHRDIKPPNVLLKENANILHSYVHDFDLVIKDSALGMASDYFFWDAAGKIGLVSHYSDMVGAVLTACQLLFTRSEEFFQYSHHEFFKYGIQAAINQFISPISSGIWHLLFLDPKHPSLSQLSVDDRILVAKTRADLKVLDLFCKVFENEDRWKNQLLGSCICHFANLNAYEYTMMQNDNKDSEIRKKMKHGMEVWTKNELLEILGDEIFAMIKINSESFAKKGVAEILYKLKNLELKSYLSSDKFAKFNHLCNQYSSLLNLNRQILPQDADPKLFALLNSKNPEERKEGREIAFKSIGRGTQLKQDIHQIQINYLNEIAIFNL
ncbi:MAG: hypothetical protein H0T62_09720 [Parachlamydiaceae bacterium]|nr:hypothetical protein [Parachlamydiaceae bacterium]